jgi:hypothetical protein
MPFYHHVRIQYKALHFLAENKQYCKVVLTWFRLKALYKENSIHNIKSRKTELSKYCEMSESKFRQHYNELIRLKFITEKNGIAFLHTKNKLSELAELPVKVKTKYFNVPIIDLDFDRFQVAILKELDNQRYHNSFNKFIDKKKEKTFGKIKDAKIKRKIKFKQWEIDEFKKEFDKSQKNCQAFNPNKKGLFFDTQISQFKLGGLFGGIHRTTMSKRLKKYAKKGLLRLIKRDIVVGDIPKGTKNWIVKMQFGNGYYNRRGKLYRRITSRIEYTNVVNSKTQMQASM